MFLITIVREKLHKQLNISNISMNKSEHIIDDQYLTVVFKTV